MASRPARRRQAKPPHTTGRVVASDDQTAAPPYTVALSASAERVYREMAERVRAAEARGDMNSAHHTSLRMVDEVLDGVIPHDPVNRTHALSGFLSNVFRYRKGRMRICWIASSAKRQAIVLFISDTPRKAGDARDPYVLFEHMVRSGTFDQLFSDLGIRRPPKHG
jgi:hypothetical protein